MHEQFKVFLALQDVEKKSLFSETAEAMEASAVAMEKDFWVCLVIDALFNDTGETGARLLFKGGTSLSKGFGLIKRFSEDVDFVVFRHDLGFQGENDPAEKEGLSGGELSRLWEEVKDSARAHITGPLKASLAEALQALPCSVILDEADPDGSSLLVQYETVFPGNDSGKYIASHVKLEGGARSALDPHEACDLKPYLAEHLGFHEWLVRAIPTISPARTFLDKVMVAHKWYHGSKLEAPKLPSDRQRLSRHYYDLAMVSQSPFGLSATTNPELLEDVRKHASSAFKSAWPRYDLATPGSIHIVPEGDLLELLKKDYRDMRSMMFGTPPPFEFILERLVEMERKLNEMRAQS